LIYSGSLKLSGVMTWYLQMQAAFMKLGADTVLLVASARTDVHPPGRVFYTDKPRRAAHLRVARWLWLHKIFPRWFMAEEARILDMRVQKILANLGWSNHIDAVVKNLPNPVPECLKAFPVIGVLHNVVPPGWLSGDKQAALRQAVADTRHIVAVGQATAHHGKQAGLTLSNVIFNPLNIADIRQKSQAYTPDIHRPYILFAGRITADKGVHELLQAFALLKEDVDLCYVGSGAGAGFHLQLALLREAAATLKVSDRVHFAGFQVNPYPWMRRAKLLVMPSMWDGEAMGYVAVEACALGCGIVVTDFPASRDFFMDEVIVSRQPLENFAARLAERISQAMAETAPRGIKPGVLESMEPVTVARQYLALAAS
jgi:glycosyltransferase involved in cell wall biosynthesis